MSAAEGAGQVRATTPLVQAGGFCSPFEQIGQERVIGHAEKETDYRPNETATYPRFGNSDDVVGGKSKEGAAIKAKTEAISVEKARITRLNSLRKQREALKGWTGK